MKILHAWLFVFIFGVLAWPLPLAASLEEDEPAPEEPAERLETYFDEDTDLPGPGNPIPISSPHAPGMPLDGGGESPETGTDPDDWGEGEVEFPYDPEASEKAKWDKRLNKGDWRDRAYWLLKKDLIDRGLDKAGYRVLVDDDGLPYVVDPEGNRITPSEPFGPPLDGGPLVLPEPEPPVNTDPDDWGEAEKPL